MPIDVFVSRNALEDAAVPPLARELTEALLRWTDATEDEFIRPNVSVFVHELPQARIFAGGVPSHVARIDVKVPTVALTTQERRTGFTADATRLVQAAAPQTRFEHVWVFVSNAVDGGWGIDGKALTAQDLS